MTIRWVFLGVLLAAGCGESTPAPPAASHDAPGPMLQRVELSPAGAAPKSGPVTRLSPLSDLESFTGEAASMRPVQIAEEDQTAVAWGHLRGEGPTLVTFRDRVQPAEFNSVSLRVLCRRNVRVRARLARGSKVLVRSSTQVCEASRTSRWVHLDFPSEEDLDQQPDRLQLLFLAPQVSVALGDVELTRTWYPRGAPMESIDRVALGPAPESRRGIVVHPGRAVRGTGTVAAGGELLFAYGSPRDHRDPGSASRLALTVRGDRGSERHVYHLEPLAEPEHWQDVSLSLDAFAGQDVELVFAVEDPSGRDPSTPWFVGEPALVGRRDAAPSVLLITSDTHRADHLGRADLGVEVQTPALDRLAGEGVFFENCFSTTNITNPSHISIMTGVSPRDSGIVGNAMRLADAAPTLAEEFRAAGYLTIASVSVRHLFELSGLLQGFDRFAGSHQRNVGNSLDAGESVQDVLRWLEHAEGLPVFVWLHAFDAHAPYNPPAEFRDLYYPRDRDPFDPSRPLADDLVRHSKFLAELRDPAYPAAAYRGEVSFLDAQLRVLLEHERLGAGIVAFTSDHGESLGEHGVYWNHDGLYPTMVHVPLILRFPGGPRGTRIADPVSNRDLARTLLDLAGIEDAVLPGSNLLRDRPGSEPRFLLAARRCAAAVEWNGWYLLLQLIEKDGRDRHRVELYDLDGDPSCETDLIDREPKRARELWGRLVRWLGEATPRSWIEETELSTEQLEELVALGYLGEEGAGSGTSLFDTDCECPWCLRMAR